MNNIYVRAVFYSVTISFNYKCLFSKLVDILVCVLLVKYVPAVYS